MSTTLKLPAVRLTELTSQVGSMTAGYVFDQQGKLSTGQTLPARSDRVARHEVLRPVSLLSFPLV